MTSLFSKIIDGQIPGRFVWSDNACVAFLTIEPQQPGHTLVVPREQIDQWVDLPERLSAHVFEVARLIGEAQREEFNSQRVGLVIQGYEVPHVHLHVWPSNSPGDFDPSTADKNPDDADMDRAAERLRQRLRLNGHEDHVPAG